MSANNSEAEDASSASNLKLAGGSRLSQATFQPANPSRTAQRIPEFSEVVLACRHHLLLLAFLGAIISSGLAAGAWWFVDETFEAESFVQVRQHQDVVFAAQVSRADDIAFVRAQEELVLAPQVLAAALQSEQLLPFAGYIPNRNAVDWLKEHITADIQVGSEVLSVSARHTQPGVAHALSNAVTSSYLTEITTRLNSDRQLRELELERAAREADRRLDALWEDLNSVASRVGTENTQSLTIRDEIQLQAYRDYAQQLRMAQLKGNELKQRIARETLRQAREITSVDEATELLLKQQPDILLARQRVTDVNARIQQMQEIAARDDSPRLKRLAADRDTLVNELQRLKDETRPLIRIKALEQAKAEKANSLAQLKNQVEANDAEKEFLRNRLSEIDAGNTRTDKQNGVQLEISRHAVERQTRLADELWQSLEELRIESQSQPRVALIKLADFPINASHSRQVKAATACGALGWLLVLFGIGCGEWYGCRVRTVSDISSHSALTVLGYDESSPRSTSDHMVGKGVREAAAKLMLVAPDSTQVPNLMVTSATAGEPRHYASLGMSRAFASFRRRTLLIDCDVERPQMPLFLGAENQPGMYELIAENAHPHQFILGTQQELLDVLLLGQQDDPSKWLDPQILRDVLQSIRDEYDAIVINGPPMSSSAASLLLASQADHTVLAVFNGCSRWTQLAACEKNAVECGITVAGVILHAMKQPEPVELIRRHKTEKQRPYSSSFAPTLDETEATLQAGIASIQHEVQRAALGQPLAGSKLKSAGEIKK